MLSSRTNQMWGRVPPSFRACVLCDQVVDDLDFVPMDEFQKKFFLLRQEEWSEYKDNFPRR